MQTISHGEMLPLPEGDSSEYRSKDYRKWDFGYMFPELQSAEHLLEPTDETVSWLKLLGASMEDPGEAIIPGVPVPAIHTFVGQFVDHDITLERGSRNISLASSLPLTPEEVKAQIVNSRSPNLDLDHVYGPDVDGNFSPRDPRNSAKMLLAKVDPLLGLPPGKDVWNDVPRDPCKYKPLIGDTRNDDNIVTLQLHVAFLRAHNALIDRGYRFNEAQKLLIQHYQWIILDDFLERIADPNIVRLIKNKGARFFDPPARAFFMPLEFSVAAYRFGHSKVRAAYDNFNSIHESGVLNNLFRPNRRLSDDWIIEWPSFLDAENPGRFPRPLDTSLTPDLLALPEPHVAGSDPEKNLAIRNLLRGYILRMPTGQAVAKAMASQGIQPMTEKQIALVVGEIPGQIEVIEKTKFLRKTPLWFYLLAEASYYSRGHHLGPVGSTIVAEVLIRVLRYSTYSILSESGWRPTLGSTPGKFDLEDLLKLAGVF